MNINTAKGRAAGAPAKPVLPDDVLAAFVGSKPLPRAEIAHKLLAYIRNHGLQDPNDRQRINADDKLRPLFNGREQATLLELSRFLHQHFR